MSDEIKILTRNLHQAQLEKNQNEEVRVLIKLGQANYQENEFEKAELNFKNALTINPKLEGINYYLALCKIQKDEIDKSRQYLKEELKINNKNKFAKSLLSKLEIKSNFPIITLLLVLLNIGTFYFIYPKIGIVELIKFTLSNNHFNIISAITSLFFHINIIHLSLNMIFLLMFGLILEKQIGSGKFLLIYLLSGIIGNGVESVLGFGNFVLGASSAIFGIVGATLLREPLLKMRIFGIIKAPMIIIFGGFFAISNLIFNMINLGNISSGDIAHITGFLIGILIMAIFERENIFVFYNWLFIATGFWLIYFAVTNLINQFSDIGNIVLQIMIILVGAFFIAYSYLKLKTQILEGAKNEN